MSVDICGFNDKEDIANNSDSRTKSSSNIIVQIVRGRAPIASMDAMEDMDILTGSNPVINNGITIIIVVVVNIMKIILYW